MANIYFFKYNNYYNKLLKVSQDIDGYGEPLAITQGANFNPNDGITTTRVVDAAFTIIPDYCVILSDQGEIDSRWFVMSCKRLRRDQWRVDLLRDSLAEYRAQILDAVCFIEKGYVNNANPLVFNNENMGFNQIKSGEYLLENNLHTPWLVLYLSRYNNSGNFNSFTGDFLNNEKPTPNYDLSSLQNYDYYYFTDHGAASSLYQYSYLEEDNLIFLAEYRKSNQQTKIEAMALTHNSFSSSVSGYGYPRYESYPKVPVVPYEKNLKVDPSVDWGVVAGDFNRTTTKNNLSYNSYTEIYYRDFHIQFGDENGYKKLTEENNKIIKINDAYSRLIKREANKSMVGIPSGDYAIWLYQGDTITLPIDKNTDLGRQMRAVFFSQNGIDNDILDTAELNFKVICKLTNQFISLDKNAVTPKKLNYDISYNTIITRDAPYEIVAAPLYDTDFQVAGKEGQTEEFHHQGHIALQGFQDIINKYHGENGEVNGAYDLQILPYCPIDNEDLTKLKIGYFFYGDLLLGQNLACYIYLEEYTFTNLINISNIPIRSDYKLSNELDLYRIVSPNGVGEYEYSPAKNGGSVNSFEVDCTLIPFNPYIKINPVFSGLYGADYNDYRGLICGGDFSLPIVSNAWETYQLQNKYYQDIFNRQISHQEYNNKFSLAGDIVGATAGTVAAGVEGLKVGGGVGAAVGAGLGLATGTADVITNQLIRKEEIQYQKDQFGFQLGTIKARMNSLTRTTSFNQNNKYFPYVEYYTCTEVEEEALKNKIKYNGMTVGVIGKISNYLSPTEDYTYIQGELIEIDIPDNYQMVEEIARRLRGGIRIA